MRIAAEWQLLKPFQRPFAAGRRHSGQPVYGWLTRDYMISFLSPFERASFELSMNLAQ